MQTIYGTTHQRNFYIPLLELFTKSRIIDFSIIFCFHCTVECNNVHEVYRIL